MPPFPGCLSPPVLLTTMSRRCTSCTPEDTVKTPLRQPARLVCPGPASMTLWPRARTPRALRRLPSLPALLLALHSEGDRMSTPRRGSHSILCLGPTLATPPTRRTCLFQTALSRTHTFTFSYVTPTYHPAVSTPLAQAHPLQLPRASGDSPHS